MRIVEVDIGQELIAEPWRVVLDLCWTFWDVIVLHRRDIPRVVLPPKHKEHESYIVQFRRRRPGKIYGYGVVEVRHGCTVCWNIKLIRLTFRGA